MFSLYFSLSLSPLSLSTFSVLQEGGFFFFFVGADEKKKYIYIYREYQTLFTALNVQGWKRIGMDVRKLLIWGVRERICFIRRRLFGIIRTFSNLITTSTRRPRR